MSDIKKLLIDVGSSVFFMSRNFNRVAALALKDRPPPDWISVLPLRFWQYSVRPPYSWFFVLFCFIFWLSVLFCRAFRFVFLLKKMSENMIAHNVSSFFFPFEFTHKVSARIQWQAWDEKRGFSHGKMVMDGGGKFMHRCCVKFILVFSPKKEDNCNCFLLFFFFFLKQIVIVLYSLLFQMTGNSTCKLHIIWYL